MNPKPIKKCSCGLEYYEIPKDAVIKNNGDIADGAWWNCECKSTLFVKKDVLDSMGEPLVGLFL